MHSLHLEVIRAPELNDAQRSAIWCLFEQNMRDMCVCGHGSIMALVTISLKLFGIVLWVES
jgi:hypothetical protein